MPVLLALALLQAVQRPDYTRDLDALLADLKADGAYVRDDGVDFAKLDAAYRPRFAGAKDRTALLRVLEAFVEELHDFHAFVGSNDGHSPRTVPSGTDLRGEWRGERAFVREVRPDSLLSEAGIRAGDEILQVGERAVREAARGWFGVLPPGSRGWDWALDQALAARWDETRELHFSRDDVEETVSLPTAREEPPGPLLDVKDLPNGLILLRPRNSLGDTATIAEIDAARPRLLKAKGIMLDLRDTPSGGNTAVARGLMGVFLDRRMPYQRHLVEERATGTVRDWVEYATPRGISPLNAPMVVLVDAWTGSMGEGIAVGLDAMRRATVVGTRMAGLRGAVGASELPVSGYRVFFPIERLYTPNLVPRHEWLPPVRITPGPGDPWLAKALALLNLPKR